MNNLIFDLDGTLIDSRTRLYQLFQALVPASNLSHEAYWAFKRDGVSNQTILSREMGLKPATIERFVTEWMARIEAPEFLALDQDIPGVHETLDRLGRQARLHVCTARQDRQSALKQLERHELLSYFETVLVTEQRFDKVALITKMLSLGADDWIIGDTGKDVQAGKSLGIKTCAVLSGFLNRKKLLTYNPDIILESAAFFACQLREAS